MWLILLFTQLHADPVGLCAPAEQPLFSCALQNRVYSLCASADLTAEKGYVQFRAGQIGQSRPGRIYPTDEELPARHFGFWSDASGAGVTFNRLEPNVELFSSADADRVTINHVRYPCARQASGVYLGAPVIRDFLRAAGLSH